jgi:hypothetical protein
MRAAYWLQEARGAKLPLRVSSISPGIVETEFFTVSASDAAVHGCCVCCVAVSLPIKGVAFYSQTCMLGGRPVSAPPSAIIVSSWVIGCLHLTAVL